MSRPPPPAAERLPLRLGAFLLGSALVHGLALVWVGAFGTGPGLDVDFEIPMDIELGIAGEMQSAAATPAEAEPASPPPAPPEGAAIPAGEAALEPRPDAGPPVDAGPDAAPDAGALGADAGPDAAPDAGPDAATDAGPDAGAPDAGPDASAAEAGMPIAAHDGGGPPSGGEALASASSRIPPGAQLAVRIDMAAVRGSALGPSVRGLLATIPDWQLLLEGSGVDPIDDLDRILIASPNLERARMVFAGRHRADEAFVRAAVARMAAARGETAEWGSSEGVSTAPWHDADATERLIAIVGPQHFIVSRPEDLARVLALATARADRDSDEEGLETTLASEALLALGPGEAFRFEAEGARRFAPRAEPHQIPERMRLAIREFPDGRVRIEGAAFFDDAAQAGEGREFWQGQIAAQGTMLTLLGFGSALQALRLELRGRRIILETELTQRQAQLAIGLLQGLMQGWVRDMERRRAERTRRAQDAPPP